MANIICGGCAVDHKHCGFISKSKLCPTVLSDSETLYTAGYRKQSEGEWKKLYDKAPRYVCTICNHLFNNKEYKHCPNCGAKMKGEQYDKRRTSN